MAIFWMAWTIAALATIALGIAALILRYRERRDPTALQPIEEITLTVGPPHAFQQGDRITVNGEYYWVRSVEVDTLVLARHRPRRRWWRRGR